MTSIGSAFSTANPLASSSEASSAFNQSAETYLQLFLVQMQNQDPTKPMDTAELTASLSQLTNSQQLIEVNESIEKLVEMQNNLNSSSVSSFINKQVQYQTNEIYFDGSTKSKLSYFMDKTFVSGQINVLDEKGDIVYFSPIDSSKGLHELEWEGKDKFGNVLEAGDYTVQIFGIDEDKDSTAQKALVNGIVTGIDFTSASEPLLKVVTSGDKKHEIELSKLASIDKVDLNDFYIGNN